MILLNKLMLINVKFHLLLKFLHIIILKNNIQNATIKFIIKEIALHLILLQFHLHFQIVFVKQIQLFLNYLLKIYFHVMGN